MKTKITAICLIIIMCALTGCQLARENADLDDSFADSLIGVFVTTEYLDLFDVEGYLNDNLNGFNGGEITIDDNNSRKYQGRIYATLKALPLTDEETGEVIENWEYVFDGLDGIPCFTAKILPPGSSTPYISSISDESISGSGLHVLVGDEENKMEVDAIMYVSPALADCTYYFNPVYQSADGGVYLESGSGMTTNTPNTGEGEMFSLTIDGKNTVTENGKSVTYSTSVKLTISVMLAPEKIIVLQMDADGALLSRLECEPGSMPEIFEPEARTAFMVVETKKRAPDGAAHITRDIYERDAESMETFRARADGICVKHTTQIEWR